MLDPVQNLALRTCLGAFRTSPVESLQVEANEPPLSLRRKKLALQYATKVLSNPKNPTYNSIFNPQFEHVFLRKPNAIPPLSIRIQQYLLAIQINTSAIAQFEFPTIPPWLLYKPNILMQLHANMKSDTAPDVFKQLFCEVVEEFLDHIQLYTDGSKEGNRVACAMVTGSTLFQCRLPDRCSIFTAELRAILLALDFIEGSHHDKFLILSDSLSSLQSIKNCNLDHPLTRLILEKCHIFYEMGKNVSFCWLPSHVGIKGNEKADSAARAALSFQITEFKIPYMDIKSTTEAHFVKVWQEHWNNITFNKLKLIKPNLGLTKLTSVRSRRDQTVLYRIRIGHTYLTHCFLLKRDNHPQCSSCNCDLTVEHILLNCPALNAARFKYFTAGSLVELFNTVPSSNILSFLKEIGLYSQL
jgi:ribonuclease HI